MEAGILFHGRDKSCCVIIWMLVVCRKSEYFFGKIFGRFWRFGLSLQPQKGNKRGEDVFLK